MLDFLGLYEYSNKHMLVKYLHQFATTCVQFQKLLNNTIDKCLKLFCFEIDQISCTFLKLRAFKTSRFFISSYCIKSSQLLVFLVIDKVESAVHPINCYILLLRSIYYYQCHSFILIFVKCVMSFSEKFFFQNEQYYVKRMLYYVIRCIIRDV